MLLNSELVGALWLVRFLVQLDEEVGDDNNTLKACAEELRNLVFSRWGLFGGDEQTSSG